MLANVGMVKTYSKSAHVNDLGFAWTGTPPCSYGSSAGWFAIPFSYPHHRCSYAPYIQEICTISTYTPDVGCGVEQSKWQLAKALAGSNRTVIANGCHKWHDRG